MPNKGKQFYEYELEDLPLESVLNVHTKGDSDLKIINCAVYNRPSQAPFVVVMDGAKWRILGRPDEVSFYSGRLDPSFKRVKIGDKLNILTKFDGIPVRLYTAEVISLELEYNPRKVQELQANLRGR